MVLSTQNITTGLTLLVSVVWLATFVVRLFQPAFSGAATIDAAMLLMLGFWFSNKALSDKKTNGNGNGKAKS